MVDSSGPAKILLIDDNPQGLLARKIILQDIGYAVTTAGSGEEGVELFREALGTEPYSLVVTDYRMPGIDGGEVVRRIRALARDTPLVILSGFAEVGALAPESTGADEVLAKGPREQFDLVDTVRRLAPCGAFERGKPPASEFLSATGRKTRRQRRKRAG